MASKTNEKVEVIEDPIERVNQRRRIQMFSGGMSRNAPGRRDSRHVSWRSPRNPDGMDSIKPPKARALSF